MLMNMKSKGLAIRYERNTYKNQMNERNLPMYFSIYTVLKLQLNISKNQSNQKNR